MNMAHVEMTKRRIIRRDNIGLASGALAAVGLAIITDNRGMPHKWHTAIFGTVLPFLLVILTYPLRWRRWSFWASLAICLAVHSVLIWLFFQYALANVRTLGLLFWLPIAFVEMFVLFVAVKKVEEKLTGKKERFGLKAG